MSREVLFFTEMGYTAYPQDQAKKLGYNNLMFPNEFFSPEKAQELYSMYFEELQYCTESGFDGVMINEHHNNPLCMMPSVNVIGSVLARTTKKGKIAFLGNVLPIHENPLRIAEEIAMIDILSGGRVVCGFVRGIGQESIATNTNPVYNRERFDEAHNVIIKAWTNPGPFRYEGKHYQYRVVNPWVLPMQKPRPDIWFPGPGSPESVVWAAQHGHPYMNLGAVMETTEWLKQIYIDTAEEAGYKAGPEHFGYLLKVLVADTEEKAQEIGRHFVWTEGHRQRGPREHVDPPGYQSRQALEVKRSRPTGVFAGNMGDPLSYENQQEAKVIIVGTPDTVIEKLKWVTETLNPGYLLIYGNEGPMKHEDSMRSIELLGKEVIPALREIKLHPYD